MQSIRFSLLALLLLMAMEAAPVAVPSDAQLTAKINSKLAKSTLSEESVKFRVKAGTVYWSGTVKVPQRKGAATRMANAAGARSVVNQIVVAKSASSKKKSPSPATSSLVSRPAPNSSEPPAPAPARGAPPRQVHVIIPGRKP